LIPEVRPTPSHAIAAPAIATTPPDFLPRSRNYRSMPWKPSASPSAPLDGPTAGENTIQPTGDAWAMVTALRQQVAALEAELSDLRRHLSQAEVASAEFTPRRPTAPGASPRSSDEAAQPHGVVLLDPNGAVTSWNEAAIHITGCTPTAIQAGDATRYDHFQRGSGEEPRRDLEEARSFGAFEEESLRKRGEGENYWASILTTSLWDQHHQLQGFATIIQDSTTRKRTEARRRLMVELALNAMVLVDGAGVILQVNPQTEKMFGYDPEELHGQKVEILVPTALGQQHAKYRGDFFANPSVRAMGVGRDLYGRRKNGSQFPVEIGLNPVQTDDGLVVLGSIVDITERKQAEERARLHLTEIAHAGRLSTVGEMFSGLAHEINQPLAAAANFARAGLRMAKSPDGVGQDQLVEWLEKTGAQVARAIDIVKRVGTFVKKDRFSQHGIVDLNQLIEDVLELPALGVGRGKLDVMPRVVSEPSLPCVLADRRQIEQVLVNLVRNAVESMADVPHDQRRLTIRTSTISDQVQVTVADAGHGISPENMERLFSPFFTTKDDGMGLGLSISRSIIEAHAGRLWADSRPGEGASFHFSLPIAVREATL
jgi:two-component system sensor kinase FixL